MQRKDYSKPIGLYVKKILKPIIKDSSLYQIINIWNKVENTSQLTPIKYCLQTSTLFLSCPPTSNIFSLQHYVPKIKSEINKLLGNHVVKSIKIKIALK